jgi:hypothetical protein
MLAVMEPKNSVEILQYLHQQGVALDQVNKNEESAIFPAAHKCNKEALYFLVKQHGLDINQKNRDDATALLLTVVANNSKEETSETP